MRNIIELKNVRNTNLNQRAYFNLVEKHTQVLEHPLQIIFDRHFRVNLEGEYYFSGKKHVIRIFTKDLKTDKKMIKVTLHEIKHALQWNKLRRSFYFNKFVRAKNNQYKDDPSRADWDSKCEKQARNYANNHIKKTMELYNSACRKQ